MPPKQKGRRGPASRPQRRRPARAPVARRKQGNPSPQPQKSRAKAAPVSITRGTTTVSHNTKTMSYRRREFVMELKTPSEIAGSTATVVKLPLNPGLPFVFPWLSTVSSFEQYKFRNLSFTFESSTSTSQSGQVVMMTNVDAKDPEIKSVSQAMSYSGAAVGRVWDSHTHRVPPQAVTKKNYLRTGTPPQNADLSLYDVGLFYVFTIGVQSDLSIGTLWVEYDVEFFTPKLATVGRSLSIRGDTKTVSLTEPLGDHAKWKIDGNNSIEWSCPDNASFCEFILQPNGLDGAAINLTSLLGESEEKKNVGFSHILTENFTEQLAYHHTGSATGLGGLQTVSTAMLQGIVDDPSLPWKFFLKYNDLAESIQANPDILPSLLVNMWKVAS